MKKLLFALSTIWISQLSEDQVGINNSNAAPDNTAMLDIRSVNRGLLIPRIALTSSNDVSTIAGPVVSLLIYNTATAGAGSTAVIPGYYYWNGSGWIPLLTGGSFSTSGWSLSGNSGTKIGRASCSERL